jgi:hypothetical protein
MSYLTAFWREIRQHEFLEHQRTAFSSLYMEVVPRQDIFLRESRLLPIGALSHTLPTT